MLKKATVTIFLMLCTGPAFGGTEELESAIMQTIRWHQVMIPRDDRRATALAIQAYWQNFEDRVPNLSPAEARWVEAEMGGSGEKLDRLLNSREFALFMLNQTIEVCLTAISSVLSSQQQDPDFEMFYWFKVLNCYQQTEDTLGNLQQAGLSDGRYDGVFKMQKVKIVENRVVNFIAPSAMAETMGWTFNQTTDQD